MKRRMIRNMKVLHLKKPNQVVYILSPSNQKRQALLRKGMAIKGTYFLPYEFRAVEIDKPQAQEQVAEL